MLGKPLWVGSTLDDIVAGPEVRENNHLSRDFRGDCGILAKLRRPPFLEF